MPTGDIARTIDERISAASELLRAHHFVAAEKEFLQLLEVLPSSDLERFNQINSQLLQLYIETKQEKKLRSVLADTQLISHHSSRSSSFSLSSHIDTLLRNGFFPEALHLATRLFPHLDWEKRPLPTPTSPRDNVRVCNPRMYSTSEHLPTFNLRRWTETCNANGIPEQAEILFEEFIRMANETGKHQTKQYALLVSLAANQSAELDHFALAEKYFECAFVAFAAFDQSSCIQLITVSETLLRKNVDLCSRFLARLFPFLKDSVRKCSLKLELAQEFAVHNREIEAMQLAREVDEAIETCIHNPVVKEAYRKHIDVELLSAPITKKGSLLLDRLFQFPKATNYELGVREFNDWSVLSALIWHAVGSGSFEEERELLDLKLQLLNDTETQTLTRKVTVLRRLAVVTRAINSADESIAQDFEEKAHSLNRMLRETRGCWVG